MTAFLRLVIASRAASLAATTGLAISYESHASGPVIFAVIVVAAAGIYLSATDIIPLSWAATAEAAVASALVALTLPDSLPVFPYLVVLPLTAGLASGMRGAALVVAAQMAALPLVGLAATDLGGLGPSTAALGPWVLITVIAGVAGSWAKHSGLSTAAAVDADYEAARRLLGELRSLSHRLSSGLDPVAIGREILEEAHNRAHSNAAAVLTRTDSGVTVPISYHGATAADRIDTTSDAIDECWASGKPVHRASRDRAGASVYVVAIPLRVGRVTTGVLVMNHDSKQDRSVVDPDDFNELALRLETALTFDDVRRIVTMDERHRLAREMHDGVAQEIASLGYEIDEVRSMSDDPRVDVALEQLRRSVSQTVSELRLSIFDLRSDVSEGVGLGAALADYVRGLGMRSQLTVHLSLDEAPTRLPPVVEAELFRIAQEAITNARKHAEAQNLWVTCRTRPPAAELEVMDDGTGMRRRRNTSYGLHVMQERADRIGATLEVESLNQDEATGTRVKVALGGRVNDLPGANVRQREEVKR